jgi:NTE family protein
MKQPALLFLLSLLTFAASAQTCDIKNLVFEGAGIRGIAYAGVIQELEKQDKLKNVEKVGGTSAGAITALMVALGYNGQEVGDIISGTQFGKFNDGKFFFFGGYGRMKNLYGWYRGEAFTDWLGHLIKAKTGNPDITFAELSARGFKDLHVTGTSLNQQKLLVFSKENYPDMKVKDAVRISMSIPLYFQAVFIDSTGRTFKNPDAKKDLDVMVDGGIVANFPIFIFDTFQPDSASKLHRIPNPQTLGVRIDPDSQIEYDAASKGLAPIEINTFNDYMQALYIFTLENLNRNELTPADWNRTISVSSAGISPRIRRMPKDQKEALLNSGREFTAAYFRKNCPDVTTDQPR